MKYVVALIIIFLLFFCALYITKPEAFSSVTEYFGAISSKDIVYDSENNPDKPSEQNRELHLLFVGDIMLDRGVEGMIKKFGNGDFAFVFQYLDFLKDADLVFGNLEGPVSDKGRDLGNLYSFRMDPKTLSLLKMYGFTIFSLANNHVGDWSREAFEDTLHRLEEAGILYTGAGKNKEDVTQPEIITLNETKIGFLGFTDVGPNWLAAGSTTSGILLASDPEFKSIISHAKPQSDILIVSFHWGDEYKQLSNDRQKMLARGAIDAGADVVIGHHPHVIEEIEEYKEGIIVYSLGNFIFDQYFSKETMEGMVFDLYIKDRKIERYETRKVILNDKYQPQLENSASTTMHFN